MEIDKVCRLCGNSSEKSMYNIFTKNDNGQQLIQLIKQCLPILVYRTDPLSKEICETCYTKLNEYSSFQKSTINTHDDFKSKLLHRVNESPVKLYIDILDNAYQPENIKITNYRSLRPHRNFASQFQIETRTNFTNTNPQEFTLDTNSSNLTILTPCKINEKTNVQVSKISNDGTTIKKRKLNGPRAGPRCKTKPYLKPFINIKFQPLSLLQCALKQVNRNLNLIDEGCNSLDSYPSTEDTTETADTGSIFQDYDEYSPSPDMSTLESSEFSVVGQKETTETLDEYDFSIDVDINEPAMCNYCMKTFPNLTDLARHEISHINVELGPRVGTKEFNMLFTKLAFYFNDYLRRQNLLPPKEVKQISKPVTRNVVRNSYKNIEKPVFRATVAKDVSKTPAKDVSKPITKQENDVKPPEQKQSKPITRPKDKVINYEEEQIYDDENSLLVPHIPNANHEFKVENNEIFINGVALRSMEKNDRKAYYKTIVVEGLKRKFCPLCRYTFKDNWSIENHYMSGVCLFTCKFCGRKFKYHKELFESHLRTHKGEIPNKVFGPKDRQYKMKFKKKRLLKSSKPVYNNSHINNILPKVKPIKIKQLMQKKMIAMKEPPIQIKTEPDLPPMDDSLSIEASTSNAHEPYQAYFCRKCFKVFFNVNEYNTHIRACGDGSATPKNNQIQLTKSKISETRVSTPDSSSSSKRPTRFCVKESSSFNESDNDSQGLESLGKKINKQINSNNIEKTPENGWECGICCSSFPSKYSRNSHMRIHKGQEKVAVKTNIITKTKIQMMAREDLQQTVATNFMQQQPQTPNDMRFSNLNPTVARLVQNNPHLTIRSYTKGSDRQFHEPVQSPAANTSKVNDNLPVETTSDHNIKRNYKCADCDERFENKSILYYHKMNSCIVKKHYECAFCRKKFGTYDQYNTHMFYVHPE